MRAGEFQNSKLVIFDIDDTLVNTDTKVNVVRDGQIVKKLNSHDFTHYHLQPGEEFDFGAFRDAREFYTQARPIPGMIRQLKQDIATGNRVIMLTARSDFNDREVFLDTFRQYGIDMSKVHVYRAGNLNIKAATEEKKKIILQHLLGKEHYDKVIMYDDSVPNLNAFLSLKQDYPWSKFYAWHVDPSGQADEYHRTDVKVDENFADGKIKGRSRPGRVKRAGASCKGSVTDLRARARKYGGERGRMYHWCANMKSGRKKS
jgi:FMN phosphatase YigB (HAD superfamily)